MKKPFEIWIKEVAAAVKKESGAHLDDLPDCPFQSWYDDGKTAKAAAKKALKNAGA